MREGGATGRRSLAAHYAHKKFEAATPSFAARFFAPQHHSVENPRTDMIVKFVIEDDPLASNALSAERLLSGYGLGDGWRLAGA